MERYEIQTMTKACYFKTTKTNDYKQALRIYEKYKTFAKKRQIFLEVTLLCNGNLLETATINPTRIIKLN